MASTVFGEPIYCYSEEQAIEDGVLVYPFPNRWKWLLITASVHAACVEESEKGHRSYEQCLVPLLMDCIMAVQKSMRTDPECDLVELEETVAGTVWCRPNAKGGLTVLLPSGN